MQFDFRMENPDWHHQPNCYLPCCYGSLSLIVAKYCYSYSTKVHLVFPIFIGCKSFIIQIKIYVLYFFYFNDHNSCAFAKCLFRIEMFIVYDDVDVRMTASKVFISFMYFFRILKRLVQTFCNLSLNFFGENWCVITLLH